MRPYDILHLLGTSAKRGTSIAKIVATLAEGLDPSRYRFHAWFCSDHGPLIGVLEKKGVRVEVIEWQGGCRDLSGLLRLFRAIHGTSIDVIHQHFGGRSFRWASRLAGSAPIIVHLHGRTLGEDWKVPVRSNTGGADLVIATSGAIAKWHGVHAEVVYPGVDIPVLARGAAVGGRNRAAVLGAAGRLVPMKGFQHLIRALPMVRAAAPDAVLEIAGSGPEEASLQQEAHRLGLDGCVRFLGWQEEVPFHRWNVLAMPSLEEPFGMVALEAMAAGLPVVASAVGGLSELIEDGRSGWLVPPADPQAIALRLVSLLQNERAQDEMGRNARKRAEMFSTRRMCERIEELYERLLTGQSALPGR
jgi:glycosyltransferase involved in cell wall biosynthesis